MMMSTVMYALLGTDRPLLKIYQQSEESTRVEILKIHIHSGYAKYNYYSL